MQWMHNTFHVSMLEPYQGDVGKAPQPGLILINGEPQYLIKKILDKRKTKDGLLYTVK
jgi:hypothetical protein